MLFGLLTFVHITPLLTFSPNGPTADLLKPSHQNLIPVPIRCLDSLVVYERGRSEIDPCQVATSDFSN